MTMDTDTLHTEILDSLDHEVDALADLGMDQHGDQPVDSQFESVDEGTLITFPPGEYRWEESHWLKNIDGLALVATDDPGEVRFTVPSGYVGRIFNFRDACDDILLEGLTFDQREDWDTSIGNVIQVDNGGRALLKDIEYAGWNPHERMGATSSLNCWALDADSTIVLDRFVQRGRAAWADYPDNPLCVFSGKASVGTLYVRNSHFENCGEHAIYASRCGPVRIEGSYFKNNQNTHARISGQESYCVDSAFVWRPLGDAVRDDTDTEQGRTGLVWESGDLGKTGGVVQTCEFICAGGAPKMSGCLKVDGSHGALDVRDCYFRVDQDDAEPFWADAPGDSHMIDGQPAEPWALRLEGCTFEGEGGWSRDGYEAAVSVAGRSGTLLRDVTVSMPNRAGLRLADGAYTMENVTIDVGGQDIITENAEVSRDTMPDPEYDHELRVVAPPDAVVEYRVVVSGEADLVTSGEYAASPKGETVTYDETMDASVIEGICAREGGDTFVYNGEIVRYETLSGPDPLVYVDGQRITLDDYRDTGPTLEEYEAFVQDVERALADLKEG